MDQIGPRDLDHHSKWPVFLRVHGSVTPEMVLPLLFVAGWSSMITLISKFVHDRMSHPCSLSIQPVLTTSSQRQSAVAHCPWFRRWSRIELQKFHRLRALQRWSQILGTTHFRVTKSCSPYLDTRRRTSREGRRARQTRPSCQDQLPKLDHCVRSRTQAQAPI